MVAQEFKKDNTEEKIKYTLIPTDILTEIAIHFNYGAKKYGENNWKESTKEQSVVFKDAAFRHFIKWIENNFDEKHGIACITNIIMYEHINKKNE